MDLLDEIGLKERQISRLSNLLNQCRDENIPEVRKKKRLLKNQNNLLACMPQLNLVEHLIQFDPYFFSNYQT